MDIIPRQVGELNIIPILQGSKKPVGEWKRYETVKCPREVVETHNGNFAVVCGKVSRNLVTADIDSSVLYERFFSDVDTFTVRTPNDGIHLYFFDERVERKIPKFKGYPIDVQSNGSFVLIPPSTIDGKKYEVLKDVEIRATDVIKLLKERLPIKEQPPDIEAFKKHINISDVIQRYVTPAHQGRGYFQALCPFHDDRKPSLTVYKDSYYCFGCGAHGDVIDFVVEREHLSFMEAIEWLSREYGVPSPFRGKVEQQLFDEKGKPNMEGFVERIMEEYNFATTYDSEEIRWYHGGVYRENAETRIKEWVERKFKESGRPSRRRFVDEIVEAIKRRTYVERSEFNPDGKICMKNGVLELDALKLEPHSPKLLFTYQLPVEYNPNADCPRFKQFCREVLKLGDIPFIQEMFGYCLRPGNELQRAFIFTGSGCNGKSIMACVLTALLGKQNVSSEPLQHLCSNNFSVAQLYGKLANVCADIPQYPVRYTGKFKELTGGDQLKGERKYQSPFYFKNSAKLFFSCNKLPQVDDTSIAFWRRWVVVEFPNCFEGREDRELLHKLYQELPGIFNWAYEGYRRLWKRGDFELTTNTKEIGETWKKWANSLYWFVTERVKRNPKGWVTKDEFYQKYIDFCEEHDIDKKVKTVVGQELPKFCKAKTIQRTIEGKRVWCWSGIEFKEAAQVTQPTQPILEDFQKGNTYEKNLNCPVPPVSPVQPTISDLKRRLWEAFGVNPFKSSQLHLHFTDGELPKLTAVMDEMRERGDLMVIPLESGQQAFQLVRR